MRPSYRGVSGPETADRDLWMTGLPVDDSGRALCPRVTMVVLASSDPPVRGGLEEVRRDG